MRYIIYPISLILFMTFEPMSFIYFLVTIHSYLNPQSCAYANRRHKGIHYFQLFIVLLYIVL